MVITPESIKLNCNCEKEHIVTLQAAVIENGAMSQINALLEKYRLYGKVAAIYDQNIWAATQGRRHAVQQEIVLDPCGLHADERAVSAVMEQLAHPDVLIAVGAGTIHDITRYCAAKLKIPFVSVPTAASVDGFVSSIAAMTWSGFKVTLQAVAPVFLVVDLDVIVNAPWQLTCSGVGDVLGKYISLADWEISHVLCDEYYCSAIAALMRTAVLNVTDNIGALCIGDKNAYAALMYALVLSGIAMQLSGNSRPASGAEHHISHLIELGLPWLGQSGALHGEKVGVGTLLCAETYHDLAAISPKTFARLIRNSTRRFTELPGSTTLWSIFGNQTRHVVSENRHLCTKALSAASLTEKWESIRRIIDQIPNADGIQAYYTQLNAKQSVRELGIDPGVKDALLRWSPYVRNRLTLMRIASAAGIL